jgi:hypothetical protein
MAYWILAILITVFGVLSSFSIGLPILVLGVTMLALGPFRGRELVFWPVLLGVLASVGAFMAIAPYSCSATMGLGEGSTPSNVVCTSLIGLRYEGVGLEAPSMQPAVLVAIVVGAVVGLVAFAAISRQARAQRQPSA